TERMLVDHPGLGLLAVVTDYVRVDGPLRGLTPQRNLGLEYATAQLVAFFDDDVVLLPGALDSLVVALLSRGVRAERLGGVGAVIENELAPPNALWRVRRALGVVPTLRPGAYTSSGMSVPWRFLPRTPADARVLHLPAAGGRPDQSEMGYLGEIGRAHV